MNPRQLSHELREGSSPDMARRRWILGLSLVGSAMAKVVSLHQTGIVPRLPDPPLPVFDSTRVDASDYAYTRLQTPDGLLMPASYAVTALLAGAGGLHRARDNPALPIPLGLKTVYDTAVALKLTREEWAENRALCTYCQIATACSVASAALAVPEAMRAVEKRKRGHSRLTAPIQPLHLTGRLSAIGHSRPNGPHVNSVVRRQNCPRCQPVVSGSDP